MNTKLLLASSSIFMGLLGVLFSFLPQETLLFLGIDSHGGAALFLQMLGALYIAFAMINWMVKASVIGGIYNRPIAMGNLIHFGIGALALVKGIWGVIAFVPFLVVCTVYTAFAIMYGIVLFRHPLKDNGIRQK